MTPLDRPQLERSCTDVLRCFATGDLGGAEAMLASLQHETHPRLDHLRGMLAMFRGRPQEAQEHFALAAAGIGDDPSLSANWALSLIQCGRPDEALAAVAIALARFPQFAGLHYCRGLAHYGRNESTLAIEALLAALRCSPGDPRFLILLGQAYQSINRHADAERALTAVTAADPGNAHAHHCLAELFLAAKLYSQALAHADRCRQLMPDTASTWGMRAMALNGLERHEESLASAEKACALDPDDSESGLVRGFAYRALGRTQEAADDFLASAKIRFAPTAGSGSRLPELRRYSVSKLRHDIEQYEYLAGLLPQGEFAAKAELHRRLLATLPADTPEERILDLPVEVLRGSDGVFNRLHHLADAPRLASGALNPALDTVAIASDYFGRGPGITWVDDLLKPEALASLRRYCLESTFWFDFHHPYGYLGALFENGFAAPSLLQIAEELRAQLPEIFLDYPLMQMWAFKYDSRLRGIQAHADIAAVNLNFWITPDDANLDPESGGLVVWDKAAPADWSFDEFNTSNAERRSRIDGFLRDSGAQALRVPYRQNRAVLFNSDLFHATDTLTFKDGYENRRINITMLFGLRNRRGR